MEVLYHLVRGLVFLSFTLFTPKERRTIFYPLDKTCRAIVAPTLYQLLSPERLIYPLRAGVARKKRHIPFHEHAVFI